MTSPADRILRDQVAAMLFAQRIASGESDEISLAVDCFRDADTFLVGRDEYRKLMAAKPAAQGGDDDLAG